MVAGKWGIQLSHRGSFGYSQKKRNACKSRKCSHDQIEKKKKKIAKGLSVPRRVVVCYFHRKLKINFSQVCST